MKELAVIVDVSGSMYALGKASVVGNVLQTLSAFENVSKMQWDGTCAGLEKLIEKCSEKNVLLLTDGYALLDSCKLSKTIKSFLDKNQENFFVVRCGGDSANISATKEFRRVRSVTADNVLYAVECFSDSGVAQAQEEDWE